MKLQLAFATALLAISTSAVQAADTRTPDILASVSGGTVQTLSKADVDNTRGKYRICTLGYRSHTCSYDNIVWYENLPQVSGNQYISIDRVVAGFWFVAR